MFSKIFKKKQKKKRLYKQFLKNRNHVKELNYEQYKTLLQSLKKKSEKNYYLDLIDSRKYNIKKVGCYEGNYWKQKSHQCPSCHFYKGGKQKYSRKKKLRKRLIIILLISVPTWLSPFPKAK